MTISKKLKTKTGCLAVVILMSSVALSRATSPWLFQLQNPNPTAIAATAFKHVVIDYSKYADDASAFSSATIGKLTSKGKIVLSYMSTGEAEDYRFYFKSAWKNKSSRPSWLGSDNPNWPGNYKVRYWDPQWRDTVLRPYLQRILKGGFSGVFLDVVDAFEYWGDPKTYSSGKEQRRAGDPVSQADAAARMVTLIKWIHDFGVKSRPGKPFLVYPNNGERLISYNTSNRFTSSIAGVVVEELWFTTTRRQPVASSNYRLTYLKKIRAAKKTVVDIEYIDNRKLPQSKNMTLINQFMSLSRSAGFDYYVARTNQQLDVINLISGVQR